MPTRESVLSILRDMVRQDVAARDEAERSLLWGMRFKLYPGGCRTEAN